MAGAGCGDDAVGAAADAADAEEGAERVGAAVKTRVAVHHPQEAGPVAVRVELQGLILV